MADIKVNDLKPAGAELFADDESFINELTNDELNIIGGQELAAAVLSSTLSIACNYPTC
ncbi:hypothetical protein [Moorena sp. SIO3H5]|uniref:hypothetical protein n=1 Tax=Moorena sp. SIO3H5 TaxID=2607834 RepID=UPI0025F9305B|nr:hypothetical protein [Moorena sp. SIO3H5]